MSSWLNAAVARKARAEAKALGHDMCRLDAGGDTAIASCFNEGCVVILEVHDSDWRLITPTPNDMRCPVRHG